MGNNFTFDGGGTFFKVMDIKDLAYIIAENHGIDHVVQIASAKIDEGSAAGQSVPSALSWGKRRTPRP